VSVLGVLVVALVAALLSVWAVWPWWHLRGGVYRVVPAYGRTHWDAALFHWTWHPEEFGAFVCAGWLEFSVSMQRTALGEALRRSQQPELDDRS